MRTLILCCTVLLAVCIQNVAHAEPRVIELKDGSVITGEVVNYANGVYTIHSDSMGDIRIKDSAIATIREPSPTTAAGPATAGTGTAASVAALKDRMLSNAEVMDLVADLKDDPQFSKVLNDPAIVQAVQTNDVAALMANPAFLALLDDPRVQEIEKKMEKP